MKKYEYWAWMNVWGNVISPHFSSKAKAMAWKKEKSFVYDNYSLFAKVKTESERANLNIKL